MSLKSLLTQDLIDGLRMAGYAITRTTVNYAMLDRAGDIESVGVHPDAHPGHAEELTMARRIQAAILAGEITTPDQIK